MKSVWGTCTIPIIDYTAVRHVNEWNEIETKIRSKFERLHYQMIWLSKLSMSLHFKYFLAILLSWASHVLS